MVWAISGSFFIIILCVVVFGVRIVCVQYNLMLVANVLHDCPILSFCVHVD